MRLRIAGWGFWSPGFADARAWLAGEHDPELTTPAPSLLPRRAHARASLLTRMLCEVTSQATTAAAVDPATITTVHGSGHGEIGRMLELLDTPADTPVSPLRFQVSVHNAPAGLISIATGNTGFSTSLSAGGDTLTACLWEATALLAERDGEVLVAVGDERTDARLGGDDYAPLAVAFVLGLERAGASQCFSFGGPTTGDGAAPEDPIWSAPELAPFVHNPCRGGALLLRALTTGGGRVALAGPGGRPAVIDLQPPGANAA